MSGKFDTDEQELRALIDRDPAAEGVFLYCVVSTSIVCRPTCPAKLALRANIIFCDNLQQALALSFRPCKRCKPDVERGWNAQREVISRACQLIKAQSSTNQKLDIGAVLGHLKVSKWYFYRTFKHYLLMTPRQFYLNCQSDSTIGTTLPLIRTKRNTLRQRRIVEGLLAENKHFLKQIDNEVPNI